MEQWPFICPGSEKKLYSVEQNSPQRIGDHIAEKMQLEFAESRCRIQQLHCPGVSPKAKCTENCRYILLQIKKIETIFRIIVFSQSAQSLRSSRKDVVKGQSIVLSEIKAEILLENDDPAYQNFLLQRHEERIKSLSHTDRVSTFCMGADS